MRPDPQQPERALPRKYVTALASVADDVYIGTRLGLYRADSAARGVVRVAVPNRLPTDDVQTLLNDDGVLWVGGRGGLRGLDLGGNDALFTQSAFEFRPGGQVLRQGLAGARSVVEMGGTRTSAVAGARQGPRPGRYTMDGLFMTIAYEDGVRERVMLMTHPGDPDIIWINGEDYIRRK